MTPVGQPNWPDLLLDDISVRLEQAARRMEQLALSTRADKDLDGEPQAAREASTDGRPIRLAVSTASDVEPSSPSKHDKQTQPHPSQRNARLGPTEGA